MRVNLARPQCIHHSQELLQRLLVGEQLLPFLIFKHFINTRYYKCMSIEYLDKKDQTSIFLLDFSP